LENKKNKEMLIHRNGSTLKNISKNIEKVLNLFLDLKTNVNKAMK
jgi:GTPase Era involved in 16S rRNA processing